MIFTGKSKKIVRSQIEEFINDVVVKSASKLNFTKSDLYNSTWQYTKNDIEVITGNIQSELDSVFGENFSKRNRIDIIHKIFSPTRLMKDYINDVVHSICKTKEFKNVYMCNRIKAFGTIGEVSVKTMSVCGTNGFTTIPKMSETDAFLYMLNQNLGNLLFLEARINRRSNISQNISKYDPKFSASISNSFKVRYEKMDDSRVRITAYPIYPFIKNDVKFIHDLMNMFIMMNSVDCVSVIDNDLILTIKSKKQIAVKSVPVDENVSISSVIEKYTKAIDECKSDIDDLQKQREKIDKLIVDKIQNIEYIKSDIKVLEKTQEILNIHKL